jgi:hypothetical protein
MTQRKTKPKRGRCLECGYSWRLRRDGALYSHWLFSGNTLSWCLGSGTEAEAGT